MTLLLLLTYLVIPYHLKMNILYYVYWLCYYSEGHGKKEVGNGEKTGISNLHHCHKNSEDIHSCFQHMLIERMRVSGTSLGAWDTAENKKVISSALEDHIF